MSEETAAATAGADADVVERVERFGVLRVGAARFGVHGRHCSGLIELSRPRPLPRSPESVLGVLYLESTIVPVLDTGRLLGIERAGPYASGLVISTGGSTAVLGVDEMVVFAPFDVRSLATAFDDSVSPRLKSFSRGVLIAGEAPVVVLDVASVFQAVRNCRQHP